MRPSIVASVALAATFSFVSTVSAQAPGFEDLARTTALTAADDYRIGSGYMEMVSWMYGETENTERQARIEALSRRLIAASDRPDMIFNVRVVPDPTVNAAALPGGFLMVNEGLIDGLSEDELAFVIAHEISHVQLRHFATTMNMTSALEVLSSAETAHAAGGDVGSSYAELSRMTTRYNRTLELEADLYGMLYVMRAGYPGDSGTDAMEAMKLLVGEIPDWMADDSTHPTFSHRIEQLQAGKQTITETYAMFDAGVAYARSGNYEAAIPAFQSFLTLFPKSSAAWSNLGTCYLHGAISSVPEDPWHDDLPVYLRADVAVRASGGPDKIMMERARASFAKALEIDPNRDAALGNLGVLARFEGQYDSAEQLLAKALELDPDYAGYLNNIGNVLAAKGDLKKADKWWGKALKADPAAGYAMANRARGYAERGKTRDAVALYSKLEDDPKFSDEAHGQLVALGAKPADSSAREHAQVEKKPEDETLLVRLDAPPVAEPVEVPVQVEPVEDKTPEPTAQREPSGGEAGDDTKFGNVGLGQTLADMVAVFGEPTFKDEQDDGYYMYVSWWDSGLSVVFTDDASTSIEIFSPGQSRTGRGIHLGSTEAEIRAAYGEPGAVYGDRNAGYESWSYDELGTAFFLDGTATVVSMSVWTW